MKPHISGSQVARQADQVVRSGSATVRDLVLVHVAGRGHADRKAVNRGRRISSDQVGLVIGTGGPHPLRRTGRSSRPRNATISRAIPVLAAASRSSPEYPTRPPRPLYTPDAATGNRSGRNVHLPTSGRSKPIRNDLPHRVRRRRLRIPLPWFSAAARKGRRSGSIRPNSPSSAISVRFVSSIFIAF